MPRIVRILGFLAVFCTAVSTAAAQSLSRDAFEGPEIALHAAGGDANFRIEGHARVAQGAHSGQWCERVTVRGTNGTSVYMAYPVPPARVISELAATVWLKADRPGLQWIARVTLPRSIDPDTGKPLSTLLRGAAYTQVGVWQQLSLGELPQALDRQTRVLRAQYGRDVDPREAYVDRLLINVYGGPGVTNVWVDDLEIAGAVPPSSPAPGAPITPASVQTTGGSNVPAIGGSATAESSGPASLWPGGGGVPTVERSGSLLLVGGKPFFPRVIEHQGEPPARLKALGFNVLWVGHVPTADLLRDAASAGIWIVGSPPPPLALESRTAGAAEKIGPQFDGVLVWDLGHGLVKSQLEGTRRWAKLVHAADPRARPMLCGAESDLTAYSRPPIHLLLAKRDVLGTTLRLENYSAWLRERAQLAMTGTTLWAAIASQPSQALIEQTTLLGQGQAPQLAWQESQLRTLVHAALAGGARGLYFQSRARLDANDAQTRRRAAMLELMNIELELIERWPASGNFATTADSSDKHATGAVIETDRSRLLLPMYTPPGSQLVTGTTVNPVLNYKVSGVPEGDNAYELSLVSFRPLPSQRVTGGTQVHLTELERDSLIVFTRDPLVVRAINQQLGQGRRRAAELARELAVADQINVEVGQQRLTALGHAVATTRPLRTLAQNDLRQAEALLAKSDFPGAYYQARHALAQLRTIERAHYDEATAQLTWPLGDPWTASFATLSEHVRLAHELTSAARGPNRLTEGSCEDLNRMMQAGWKHFLHPQDNITTVVDLSPQAAHSGRTGLRLRALATAADNKPTAVESPPMWVSTSPAMVEQGQLVEIQGWIRIAQPITASVDGLLVIDSLSGESLAGRVDQGDAWQQFTAWRIAPRSGPMTITFALAGLGEVWIDDVSIQVVNRAGAPLPQQAQQTRPTAPPGRGS